MERKATDPRPQPREVIMNRSAGSGHPPQNTPAYRNYKSQLNGMFEGRVKMPAQSPSATAMPVGTGRASVSPVASMTAAPAPVVVKTPKDALRVAESDEAILSATQECMDDGGIPMDADLIAKALTLKHERYLVPVMEALLDLMERGRPKNAKLLVQRIVQAHDYLVAAHALDLAKGLRMRLGDATV